MIQARSRYNKFGLGSTNALQGDIKVTPWDMVDYAKDGTVQGLGPNKYMDERGRGQLVFDPGAAIYGQPSFTDTGDLDPKYDKTRESLVGKGLTKFTKGLQENPLKFIPGVGTALSVFDMLKKDKSGGGGEEDVSTKRGALSSIINRPQLRPASMNVNTYDQAYKDQFGDRGENIKNYSGTNYGMPTSRYLKEGKMNNVRVDGNTVYMRKADLNNDANFNQLMPPSTTGSLDPTRGDRIRFRRNNQQYIDMGARGEPMKAGGYVTEPDATNYIDPSRFVNYAYNDSGSDDNDSYSEGVPIRPVIAPYADYAQWMPSSEYIGASSYGGPFSSASQNFASVLPPSIYSTGGSSNSVPTRFVNDRTKQYFTAPNDSYYAEENSDWRQANPYSLA